MITQYIDVIDKERIIGFNEDALVKLLQIEHRLNLLMDRLEQLDISVNISVGIVDVITKAAADVAQTAKGFDYLIDAFGDYVREGTAEECRSFLRLVRDFLFALEHTEDLDINRLDRGRGGVRDEEWIIGGGREVIARVRGGAVEWLRFYCHVHDEWLPEEGCEHA